MGIKRDGEWTEGPPFNPWPDTQGPVTWRDVFPVGLPDIRGSVAILPSDVIPQLVSIATGQTGILNSGATDGAPGAHAQSVVLQTSPTSNIEPQPLPRVVWEDEGTQSEGAFESGSNGGYLTVGIEITGLLGGIARDYIQTRWGNQTQNQNFLPAVLGGAATVASAAGLAGFGIPGVDIISDSKPKGYVYDPNANCGAGKWIKRTRRRRALLTSCEANQLQLLITILGKGDATKAWIATHGRRC